MRRRMDEFGLIQMIARRNPNSARVSLGIGDDAAALRLSRREEVLVTTDLLTEGIDFKAQWNCWQAMGEKAVAVNLSDLAAMGGKPIAVVTGIAVPKKRRALILKIQRGIEAACRKYDVPLVGGDLSAARHDVTVTVTALGSISAGRLPLRSHARPGDLIFCTGTMGDAGLGLALMQGDRRLARRLTPRQRQRVLQKFLAPVPRLGLGQKLRRQKLVHAMIDISDGLLQDLSHVLRASGVTAEIDPARIPQSAAFRQSGRPLVKAVTAGEDFELLFTAPARLEKRILRLSTTALPITRIGKIIRRRRGLGLDSGISGPPGYAWPKKGLGFQHF